MRDRLSREKRPHSKTRHQPGMLRDARNRAQDLGCELMPVFNERLYESAPGFSILAQANLRIFKFAFQNHRRAIVERVGKRNRRMNPVQSVSLEREGGKERRAGTERMNCRSK